MNGRRGSSFASIMLLLAGSGLAQNAPTITTQPVNQVVPGGGHARFAVAVSGDGPFTYQWRLDGTNLPNIITTFAGGGYGDGGQATNAVMNRPQGVAVDAYGNLFIADSYNNRIRKVWTNGLITTVAGNGVEARSGLGAYSGDGGPATQASLFRPEGVAADALGNLFIADTINNRVRKVDANGVITTVAGNGYTIYFGSNPIGEGTYSGDGGPATNASLNWPMGVTVDASGNLFIADSDNNRIRKVDTNGIITTVAGNGNSTVLGPSSVAVDAVGNLFIADQSNARIRKMATNGTTTTVSTSARLSGPVGVVLDAAGNVLVSDAGEHVSKIATNGTTTLIAGTGSYGYSGDGGAATNAMLSSPCGLALDTRGNLFIADEGNNRIRKIGASGTITTVTGDGFATFSGDGGPAIEATLADPSGITLDGNGNMFIADCGNNRVRKVDTNGIITTVAGNTNSDYTGDGGLATNASLYEPTGVAVDAQGNLFIADYVNHRIRKVDTNGIISTVAGTGYGGASGYGGPATNAAVGFPSDVAFDCHGNLFIAGGNINRVLEVGTNQIIYVVAGNTNSGYAGDGVLATNTSLYGPDGIALDAAGNLYIADYWDNRIRMVDTNDIITTVAGVGPSPPYTGGFQGGFGGDGGPATAAQLWWPCGVAVDSSGNLFLGDANNERIRKVDTNGIITTVAGTGAAGFSGDGGAATNATMYGPVSLAVDARGNLFFSDANNNRVRELIAPGPMLTLNQTTGGNAGSYDVVVMNAYGSVTSSVATLTVTLPPLKATVSKANGINLQMCGTPGSSYILEVRTNLSRSANWQPLITNTADANGDWLFTDTNSSSSHARFYRATVP